MNWPGLFEDGIPLLILLLGTIILTALIVWLLLRRRYDGLRAKFDQKIGEFSELQNTYNVLLGKEEEMKTRFSELNSSHQSLNLRFEQQKGLFNDCSQKRTELESENLLLKPFKAKYEQLLELHSAQGREIDELKTARADLQARKEGLEDALRRERNENKLLHDEVIRLQSFENRYSELESKLKEQEEKLAKIAGEVKAAPQPVMDTTTVKGKEKEAEVLERIKGRAEKINYDRIGMATIKEKDDLKLIKGIGPFIEKKLHVLNIFTFKQIASFNDEDEDMVNEAIEFFPGRIKRDKWVSQARAFVEDPKSIKIAKEALTLERVKERAKELNFERIGTATADEKDDLKRVKGIGPFIEKKLNSIGIYTFRQIANFQAEDEDKVNEVIEFFPGRIRRDQWSKQAEGLSKAPEQKK